MKNINVWRVSGIAEVGYKVGNDDDIESVAMQLVQSKVRISAELGGDLTEKVQLACLDTAERLLKNQLCRSDVNYGVVGLKRWHVQFRHINCSLVSAVEVEEDKVLSGELP